MPTGTDLWVSMRRRHYISLEARRMFVALGGVMVALTVAMAVSIWLSPDAATVSELTVRNDFEYDVHISVGSPSSEGVALLGTAVQRCDSTFHLVLDQGDEWQFHFRTQGMEAQPVNVTRSDLEATGWVLTLPETVYTDFARQDAQPPPKKSCV